MNTLILFEKKSTYEVARGVLPAANNRFLSLEGHIVGYLMPDEIPEEKLKSIFLGEAPTTSYKSWTYDNLPFLVRSPVYKVGTGRSGRSHKPLFDTVKQALASVDCVMVATDPGREGSLIAWELIKLLNFRGQVRRMRLGAVDEKSVVKAYQEALKEGERGGDRDYCRYLEGLARQFRDYHSGMNGTRCLNICFPRRNKIDERFSYGEVIIPALSLLAQLEDEIENFKPETFFKIAMTVDQGTGAVRLVHKPKEHLKNKEVAEKIAAEVRNWRGPLSVERKERSKGPPALFSIQKLFRESAKQFGWRTDKTEATAQELYDKGYCTYPRTEVDQIFINDAAEAPGRIAAIASCLPDESALIETPLIRKNTTYTSEECEHYAYVPTAKPLANTGDVSPDALKLYLLVAKRYLAHHLPDAVDFITSIEAKATTTDSPTPKSFRAMGTIEKTAGWRAVYRRTDTDETPEEDQKVGKKGDDDEEENNGKLPSLTHGAPAAATGSQVLTGETTPPKRITSGGLAYVCQRLIDWVDDPKLKAALHNDANPNNPKGLGTASSQIALVPNLTAYQYAIEIRGGGKKQSKDPALKVTPRGMDLWRWLKANFKEDADPVARAVTEFDLGKIGNLTVRSEAVQAFSDFMTSAYDKQRRLVAAFKTVRSSSIRGADGVLINPVSEADRAARRSVLENGVPIDVPFGKNDAVKAIGAVWDAQNTVMRIPGESLEKAKALGCKAIEGPIAAFHAAREERKKARASGIPILVPYTADKSSNERAKALGAVWSKELTSWIAPGNLDIAVFEAAGFKRWDPKGALQPINVPWDDAGVNRAKATSLGAMFHTFQDGRKSYVVPAGVSLDPFIAAGFGPWDPPAPKSGFKKGKSRGTVKA